MQRVAAVIVTFNRADKLGKVIEHVQRQTHPVEWIIVVDNASTDNTADVLAGFGADPRLRVRTMPENTGGAGGFAEGMSLAMDTPAEQVWIMDDDCYAHQDALEKLVAGYEAARAALNERVVFAGSMVRWTDGSLCLMNQPQADHDWGDLIVRGLPITLVASGSFVSLLIPAELIREVGLPLREYFIWWDDMEYTSRLGEQGRGIMVHDSLVVHDLASNLGVNYGLVDESNVWKFTYGARNESSYRWHRNKLGWLRFVLQTGVRMNRGKVATRHRRTVYRAVAKGMRFNPQPEAVGHDARVRPEPPAPSEQQSPPEDSIPSQSRVREGSELT